MNFFDLLLARKLGGGGALPTETATVTPTTSEQTVTPTAGHTLSSVTVNAIPSEYVIPTGTKQITQNGTGIDVSQYASVDVAVTPVLTPVLLDTIDVEDFAEQVNIVEIDPTIYDLTGKYIIYVVAEDIVPTAADWLYYSSGYSSVYFAGSSGSASLFNCQKLSFVKIQNDWINAWSTDQGTRLPTYGDQQGLKKIKYNFYSSNTKFVSGRFKVYAL